MNIIALLPVGSRMGTVCLCVCFNARYLKTNDAARITKLDRVMFHNESWKSIYFGVKGQVTRTLPAWVLALL